jgi:hypothetical protein
MKRPRLLTKSLWLHFGFITDWDRGTPVPHMPEEAAQACRGPCFWGVLSSERTRSLLQETGVIGLSAV